MGSARLLHRCCRRTSPPSPCLFAVIVLATLPLWLSGCATGTRSSSNAVRMPTFASALKEAAHSPPYLVSVGDSITFGENLPGSRLPTSPTKQGTPSKDAFPFIVGRDNHMKVFDLGRPAFTSGQLLQWLQTGSNPTKLAKADLVTLDAGSNDLLETAYNVLASVLTNPSNTSPQNETKAFDKTLTRLEANLTAIIGQIRRQTQAPIILMNLYNPFPDATTLHDIAEPLLAQANQVITKTAVANDCYLVNTYAVMNHRQQTLTRLHQEDIHPSIAGQKAIASLVDRAIAQPENYTPQRDAILNRHTPVYHNPRLFASVETTLPAGTAVQVLAVDSIWLTVRQGRYVGYVRDNQPNLVNRPWPDARVPRLLQRDLVKFGRLSVGSPVDSLEGFVWHGTVYGPLLDLVHAVNGNLTEDDATLALNVTTPSHSGLEGWWQSQTRRLPPLYSRQSFDLTREPVSKAEAFAMTFLEDHKKPVQVDVQTTAYMLQEDGEPVPLAQPVVTIGGTLYVPAVAFWASLGGTTAK